MKIAFDAKRAAQNRTGLGNYSRLIIEGFSRCYPENNYLLHTPITQKTQLLGTITKQKNCLVRYPQNYIWKRLSSLWRISGICKLIKADNVSIYHGLSNELPFGINKLKKTKSVVTIHDLIFLRYPEFFPLIDRTIYRFKFKHACKVADRVIAISECTKRDIMHYFGTPEDKIKVIYQGCDESFCNPVDDALKQEVRDKYSLPEKYLLCVGSIESRKNLLLIVKALKESKSNLPLVAVGKYTPYAGKVLQYAKEHGLSERLLMFHNVEFKHLLAFYQMASLFIYPSFFEGFGIPLLEALNSKVPVIGATGSCLEEAGGPHSLYVNPEDPKALAEAIDRVISDEKLQQEMISKGLEYASRFEQNKLIPQMMEVYHSLL